jgi:hypothetical protein
MDILDRLRAATEGTTPGPWEASSDRLTDWDVWVIGPIQGHDCEYQNAHDARLIASAPTLIPEAADTIEALRAEVDALRAGQRAAWEAGRDAALEAIPTGWTGQPHCSNMDYGPNVAAKASAAIRALTPPAPDA